jgi:histidinol-phosphate/aromatic aminotransferase/cobyric acid decarboxylase-like protein
MGIREIVPGEANFLMFHLEEFQPAAPQIISLARKEGIFLRNVASMGSKLESRALRIAIKDSASNNRVVEAVRQALLHEESPAIVSHVVSIP